MTTIGYDRKTLPRRRWRIAWLLGLGVLINYFDRVNLSVSHDALFAAFGVSDVVFGYLSSAYNLTYACLQLPVGVILDKLGVKKVGRISTFLWSCASFAGAVTPSLSGLFGARFLLGVGEAPSFPANAKATGLWFPTHERSFATSCFDAAAKFASVIGIPLMGFVLIRFGWRWSFGLTGLLSLGYFLLFWRVYRDPADDPDLSPEERAYIDGSDVAEGGEARAAVPARSLFYLLGQRKVIGLLLGFGAYNYVFYLLLAWLPTYISSALHIDLMHSFLDTSVPWIVATCTDLLIGGMLVDTLIRRGYNPSLVRGIVLIGGMTFGLGIFGAAHAATAGQALLWISICIGGLAAAAPVAWSIPSLITSRNNVGKVGGIINFSAQVSGIVAQVLTGYIVEDLHSYVWVFVVPSIYLVIGILAYIFLLGRIELTPALE